jgi:hypothetical protein
VTVAEAVIARLLSLTAVTNLVSTRVYQLKLPQKVSYPAIRVQRIDTVELGHLRGTGAKFRSRIQVDSVSSENAVADPLTAALAVDAAAHGPGDGSALAGWKGQVGSSSPAFAVAAVLPLDVREFYVPNELLEVGVSRDYEVWHDA